MVRDQIVKLIKGESEERDEESSKGMKNRSEEEELGFEERERESSIVPRLAMVGWAWAQSYQTQFFF